MANLKLLRYKTTSEFNNKKSTFDEGDIVFNSEAGILYIVTDKNHNVEPYYGSNAIKNVSLNNATLTISFLDGTSKNLTVNNVTHAGEATKATNDSENNPINTTYFKKSGGTINGATTINGGLTATGETDVESLTADSLIVNGSTRFNNDVIAATFTGNLKGNADTATSASTAGTASKLSTGTTGSTTQPIYFKDGVPTAITGAIANNTTGKATTAGTADYATKVGNSTNSYTYAQLNAALATLTTSDTNLSNRLDTSELALGNKISEIENNVNDITDWQQNPTADEITTNQLKVLESINIGGTVLDKTEYQGNAKTATSASTAGTASKLSSNAGSATLPVYFTSGVPKAINTTGVGISITGSAASATKDASGNVITNTYATKTELASKSDKTHTHSYAGSASAGGAASSIATVAGTTNADRPVFFGYDGDNTRVVYDNDFLYNPSTNTLKIGTGTLTGTAYSGEAATAKSALTASTASKLQTARTIALGTAVTSTATSFNGESNITIPVNSVKEAYLTWGGKNFSGEVSPVGAALSTEHSANRIALINGDALTIEYSTDGGSTWTDSGFTTDEKIAFCTSSNTVLIGRAKGQSSTACTTNSKTRITLTAQNGTTRYLYTSPRKLLLNVSTAWTTQVLIETKTGKSDATWTTFGTYNVSGWSAWNDIPLMLGTLGGSKTQTGNTWYLRLTFSCVSINSSLAGKYDNNASVLGMRLFGVTDWAAASIYAGKGPMSSTGHLYSYDVNANATFPATVTAKSFSGELAGNASSATKLQTARNINGTSFNGTSAITTATWGTARTISITDGTNTSAGVSVNGSSDFSLKLPSTIKANFVGSLTGNITGNAATATKLNNALTIGGVKYDGSSAQTITAATLGLSSALLFLGTTTTALSDGSTTNPITINNASVTAKTGNVVLYDHLEFIWNGSSWEELGDEESFALKSVQINAGSGLTGGGTLEATMTISHDDTSSQASITTGGRTYINSITLDDYGHVIALGTGTETNQTDISGNAATATKATTASYLTSVDKRADYPGNIVTSGARIGGSFMSNSTLGISNNGSYSDAIIIRGYGDYSGGPDNALIFNKGTTNVWHTQFTFGSTDSWGTPILFLDTNNYNSYAPKLDGTGATGTWGINISGNADTSSACTGNSATATKATNDSDGNKISTTYVKKVTGASPAVYHVTSLLNKYGIKIELPLTWEPQQSAMFAFTVRIYNGYEYTDIVISGYNYGSNHWYAPKAEIIGGTKRYTVKFGWNSDPKTLFIWIGNVDTTTAFSYGGLSIFNVHSGYVDHSMTTGWSYSFCSATELEALSNLGGIQSTQTPVLNAKADGTNVSGTWGINISGNADTSSACTGNSATATRASSVGTNDSMKLYAQYNSEINFGGTNTSGVLYFGYRATDSKPVPTSFIFGGSNGTATLTANGFKKKDSSDSYVLTGGGGHSKISDLSVAYATTSGSAISAGSVPWSGITSKPTTLSGYGITNGLPTYTVNADQSTLTWIQGIAQKQANRMSFYYNYNGTEYSYLLGCRNTNADDDLKYGSILKFGYSDTYLRILRVQDGTWKSTDWEKISAGYADTSGSCSGNSATATTLATSRTLWGQSFNGSSNVDGTIRITPTTGNWTEGIRIKPYSGWTTILLGGTEVGNTGTSTNSWSLHTYGGNFYVNRNASNSTTSYILCNVSGNWGMGTNSPSYKLDVQGTLRATGATTFSSSLSVTGDIAASSNVNVTNQTRSKTFSINGGCTLEYDSTNKCVKFVF